MNRGCKVLGVEAFFLKNKIHHQQRNTQLPKPKMKKWTHKHEKNQHPITLQTPKNLKKNKIFF